jgi:sulfhydrogenase subunit delta
VLSNGNPKKRVKMQKKKPVVGLFTFTCCEGCGFTVLFLNKLSQLLEKLDIQYFSLIKEKNKEARFDLAFVEGAITTKHEVETLKKIRKKSRFLVAMGACACYGGIPAMRNFIENKELKKYVYNPQMIKDAIEAQPIGNFVNVDYNMYGCPILKKEFMSFIDGFLKHKVPEEYEGPVCGQCPRRGKDCYLREKKVCLGAVTHGGCEAFCVRRGIPCIMCRGPLETANFPGEVALFKGWGLDEKDIMGKLGKFGEQGMKKTLGKENDKKTQP